MGSGLGRFCCLNAVKGLLKKKNSKTHVCFTNWGPVPLLPGAHCTFNCFSY